MIDETLYYFFNASGIVTGIFRILRTKSSSNARIGELFFFFQIIDEAATIKIVCFVYVLNSVKHYQGVRPKFKSNTIQI